MGAPPMSPAVKAAINANNKRFSEYILIILAAIVVVIAIYRVAIHSVQYIRTLTSLNDSKQQIFRRPNAAFGWLKEHVLYSALSYRRHSRQIRIGPADLGMIPTRLHCILITGIVTMNVILCTYGIEWDGPLKVKLGHLRNRSGSLAVVNMIPLVIMAGRNNPLISWIKISFDTFNLMHRWFGRIVVSLAITHVVVEIISIITGLNAGKKPHPSGVKVFTEIIGEERFLTYGFVAFVAMCTIILTSFTAFRHAFYETFLHIHIALVALTIAGLWIHLAHLHELAYIQAVTAIWLLERLLRLLSILYHNLSRYRTTASCEPLPGDAVRVTLRLARPMTITPGQHIYLYIPTISLWTSHPFSIAWSEPPIQTQHHRTYHTDPEKLGFSPTTTPYTSDTLSTPQTSISLIIRKRSGFTSALHSRVTASQTPHLSLPAFIEGPYGPTPSLPSYGTLLLFAGGVGITSLLPHLRSTIASYNTCTTCTKKITLIWIIRSPTHLEWIRPWMTLILSMPHRREILRVQLYITKPSSAKEIHSPSATVQMFPGKPNVGNIVEGECREQVGAMGVGVCGPGGLGDEVRLAVRRRAGFWEVGFWEEGFGW